MRTTTAALIEHYADYLDLSGDVLEIGGHQPGFWPSGADSVPVDQLGGWREHWGVYCVAYKGSDPAVPRFKDADHPLAVHLRRDTQGVVTNPRMNGTSKPGPADPVSALRPDLVKIIKSLDQMIIRTGELTDRVAAQDDELARMRKVLARPGLTERAYRKVRRVLSAVTGGAG